MPNSQELYVVRQWDGFDGLWIDVSEPASFIEAARIWGEKTDGGKKNTNYNHIDYYNIFDADTKMVFSYESGLSQRGPV